MTRHCFSSIAMVLLFFTTTAASAAPKTKIIADMEGETAFTIEGRKTQPDATLTDATSSEGTRSLRFAHKGIGPGRAGLHFPIRGGGEGFDILAFDIYCERETQFTRLNVRLAQEAEAPKKVGVFSATVQVSRFIDGFATVRLAVGAGFDFLSVGGAKPDWSRLQKLSFILHNDGDTIFYLDNIRLERMGITGSKNLLFNGSFELTATPDVPDGWGRDLTLPPFSSDAWGIDSTTAKQGSNSLRIGSVDKFARYWISHLKSSKDQPYTFSVALKAAQPDTRAEIRINGVKGTRREVTVGTDWTTHSVTGTASGAGMFPQVTLLSEGTLWLDAAQLQKGTQATDYQPADLDLVKHEEAQQQKTISSAAADNLPVKRPAFLADDEDRPLVTLEGTEFDFYTDEQTARARCYLNASAAECQRMRLSWWLENKRGIIKRPVNITPRPGFNEWSISLARLPKGRYLLKTACKPAGKSAVTAQRKFRTLPPIAGHQVRINQWGRFLVCDGEPHLWFGFFDAVYSKTRVPHAWSRTLDDMQSAHCNTVLMYTHDLVNRPEEITRALDRAYARGIKVWLHLSWVFSYINPRYAKYDRYRSEADAIAALEEIIATHKDHPALLGWCHLDEPANQPTIFTSELVHRWYRRIKDLDPYHPCISSHMTHVGESEIYGKSVDFALIPFHKPSDVRARNLFKEFYDAGFPICTNATFYGAISRPNESTPAQARVSIYAPIILGARGFCSYTYRPASTLTWQEIGRVGRELAELTPILCTPDQHLQVGVSSGEKGVHALLKKHDGRYFLLAVNTGPRPTQAKFRLTDAASVRSVTPLFDSRAPRVDRSNKTLSLTMAPRSTVVWEVTP